MNIGTLTTRTSSMSLSATRAAFTRVWAPAVADVRPHAVMTNNYTAKQAPPPRGEPR